ncbi:oligosaccharide flippase family protein, partial [Candidatus Woesebacteria bacterium]|nr:oligosaccharide flippase family protein [Candidatus Woesebacteria bacterium]
LIKNFYHLSGAGVYLLYALGVSLFLSSLKTIPSVLLERELQFGKLTIPQILENLTYNILAVFLAWKGFGIASFTFAVLARGIVGLVTIYILKPWIPQFGIFRGSLKKLLTFGIPYQLNTFLAVVKDDGMTVFLGGALGASGVGILGWAQKWAYAPLRFFMDHVIKVTFPAFARMQDEKEELARTTTRSIFFICFLVFPSVVGLLTIAPILVDIIPRYEKWEPALLPLSLIAINTVFASVTTQLTNLLNSIGKIKTTFKLMLFWTVATWILVPFLSIKFGVNGAAAAYALIGTTSVAAIYIVRKIVKFSLVDSALRPAIAAIFMGGALLVLKKYLPVNLASVWILITTGALVYGISIYLLVGVSILTDAKKTFSNLFSK